MKRTLMLMLLVLLALATRPGLLRAQEEGDADTTKQGQKVEELKGQVDGMNETLVEMKNTLDALKKIKVSGYLQAQYQTADTASVKTFEGPDFPTNVRSRFSVRRGRLKVNYDNDLSQYVLQIDVTQGGVGIKDAYASIRDPWLRTVVFTAGIFDRPFGYEISYSSSVRESPERSRMYQTLFPGERELGAKLEVNAEEGLWSTLNLKAGLFNGVLNNANENDRNKDFIGRAGFSLPFEEQNLAIDGGFSLYAGKVTTNSKYVYDLDLSSPAKPYRVDSLASNVGNSYARTYYGGDLQVYYDLPNIGGLALRGEYITGSQPGTSSLNSFYNPGSSVTPLYARKFAGWYVNLIQNVGVKNQLVVKYDVFDPNTDIEGSQIGAAGTGHTAADVRYATLGLGWIYHWDANVKFVLYYDIVKNETVNSAATGALAALRSDLKDNVMTVRMQYKF
jgi:hypothetical protein